MTTLEIVSSSGGYPVIIGHGILQEQLRERKVAVAVADAYFHGKPPQLSCPAIDVEAAENSKTLTGAADLIERLMQHKVVRSDVILALGGGTIQDLACFVASIYMRGVQWVYCPTTLLGMVDSCIGGKSSINVGPFKNIAGTFYPPQAIIVDPAFLSTLPEDQTVGGLCEAAKICYARQCFSEYLDLGDPEQIITLSLTSKKWFIEIDEHDRAERLLLNFGHTFGHALESATSFTLNHGVAVGVGMLVAMAFAGEENAVVGSLRTHVHSLLARVAGLAKTLRQVDIDVAVKALLADKKHGRDYLAFILPDKTGALQRVLLPRNDTTLQRIRAAMSEIFNA